MTWDELADRCLLIIDTDKNLLISLLKEAELEMTRKCNILERHFDASMSDLAGKYSFNDGFKSVISAKYKGREILPMLERDVDLDTNNLQEIGDPTGYFIRTTFDSGDATTQIVFNRRTPGTTVIDMSAYYTTQGSTNATNPIISDQYQISLCDYAIAVASAKTDPAKFNQHITLWNASVAEITNQEADKDLVHQIRNEI